MIIIYLKVVNFYVSTTKCLRELCFSNGIHLELIGLDNIAFDLYDQYHGIARDFLNITISTEQIFDLNEFIIRHDSNPMVAPLNTKFQFREKECNDILSKIDKASVLVIMGPAGVGKTRIALECCRRYACEKGYALLCISSNCLPIYDDLKMFFCDPGKYLLMVDDANQLTGLKHVLQYLTKTEQGYFVKVVLTVRDYAKNVVLRDVCKYCIPEKSTIEMFSDKEIEELLKENFGIKNSKYLKKIVNIAEGNPRLAFMAGKIAVDNQTLESINDASNLYGNYYGDLTEQHFLNQDKKLCAVAGIIAFLNAINLENLEALDSLLFEVGLKKAQFVERAHQLHESELVDIYHDKAVKTSDQCFANYLLKYVFIDKRIIPFSKMVKYCFKNFRSRVIDSTSTLGNIFSSPVMFKQLEVEIGAVWDEFRDTSNPLFFDFVKAFYVVRPTETLLLLNDMIDALPVEEFDVSKVDFEKESHHESVNDDILNILGGFKHSTHLPEALDLLFKYYRKKPKAFMQIYHCIKRDFSIQKESHIYDYFTQVTLIEKLFEHVNLWTNKNFDILFLRLAHDVFCNKKILKSAKSFPQAPVGNFLCHPCRTSEFFIRSLSPSKIKR